MPQHISFSCSHSLHSLNVSGLYLCLYLVLWTYLALTSGTCTLKLSPLSRKPPSACQSLLPGSPSHIPASYTKQPVWWRHSERLLGETITWPHDLTSPDAPGATNPKHACHACLMAAIKSSRAESGSADTTARQAYIEAVKHPQRSTPVNRLSN